MCPTGLHWTPPLETRSDPLPVTYALSFLRRRISRRWYCLIWSCSSRLNGAGTKWPVKESTGLIETTPLIFGETPGTGSLQL